jgi:hypothetical protein
MMNEVEIIDRFRAIQRTMCGWIDIETINQLAWEDVETVQAELIKINVHQGIQEECQNLEIKEVDFVNAAGGAKVKTYLAEQYNKLICYVKEELTQVPFSQLASLNYGNVLDAFRRTTPGYGGISGAKLILANGQYLWNGDEWNHLREVALLKPFTAYCESLNEELSRLWACWQLDGPQAGITSNPEVLTGSAMEPDSFQWRDLKCLALFLAIRYVSTKDPKSYLADDQIADDIAKSAGHVGKGSGHRLRGYFNQYQSATGRMAKNRLNSTVVRRYNTVIPELKAYPPECLALAESERAILRSRSPNGEE